MASVMLLESGRLQRAGWVYSQSRAHNGMDEEQAKKDVQELFEKARSKSQIEIQDAPVGLYDVANIVNPFTYTEKLGSEIDLPITFKLFLATAPPDRKEISIRYSVPYDVSQNRQRDQKIDVEIQGSSFRFHEGVKQALWLEATGGTSYPCKPLQIWGINELLTAGGIAKIPLVGSVGAALAEISNVFGAACPF